MQTSLESSVPTRDAMYGPSLSQELDWLGACMHIRAGQQGGEYGQDLRLPDPPDYSTSADAYALFLQKKPASLPERLALALAIAAELHPSLIVAWSVECHRIAEIGLVPDRDTQVLYPTLRTWCFLLAGQSYSDALRHLKTWLEAPRLQQWGVIETFAEAPTHSPLQQRLQLSKDGFQELLLGQEPVPEFSPDFPAKRIHTPLDWEDLILQPQIHTHIELLLTWLKIGDRVRHEYGVDKRILPGCRVLLFGPPGTGKTLTAALLGKHTGRDMYRIDLSRIVSKYIGETEKQLSKVFAMAQSRNWILFFDEADAIFGKRGKVTDARDRYANQEVSYLLQRVEEFDGLCILATNNEAHIDHAFRRRFDFMIEFQNPSKVERLKIWRQAFPENCPLDAKINLNEIADRHELSPAVIHGIVRLAVMNALNRGEQVVRNADLATAMQIEFKKIGLMR